MENTNAATVSRKKPALLDIRNIAQMGVLAAISFILTTLEFPVWFAPGFYRIDLSELPVMIGAFAMGPLAGVLIEFVKVVLYFFIHGSATAGVGEIANFIAGCCLVVPAALFYQRKKTRKMALLGMCVGMVLMAAAGWAQNAFVILPLYATAFHMPLASIVAMGTQMNPSVTDLSTFVLLIVVPFNLLKGGMVSMLTLLLYKQVSPILHGRLR